MWGRIRDGPLQQRILKLQRFIGIISTTMCPVLPKSFTTFRGSKGAVTLFQHRRLPKVCTHRTCNLSVESKQRGTAYLTLTELG